MSGSGRKRGQQAGTVTSEFYCYICRENKNTPGTQTTPGFALACSHVYCQECVVSYIESRLSNNKFKAKCFYPIATTTVTDSNANATSGKNPKKKQQQQLKNIPCGVELKDSEIKELLGNCPAAQPTSLQLYGRLKYLHDNTNTARACPQCDGIVLKLPPGASRKAEQHPNEMRCTKCATVFCFTHGEAHKFPSDGAVVVGGKSDPCVVYAARVSASERASGATIKKIARRCPGRGCGVAVEKSGGCNHMVCEVCETSFCWLCGTEVSDSIFPAHFQWWNPMGCVNMQMHEAIEPSTATLLCARVLATLQLVILGPLCAICTAVTLVLLSWTCLCSGDCLQLNETYFGGRRPTISELAGMSMSVWGMLWMGLLVFLPAGIGAFILSVLLYPFYAVFKIVQCQWPCPDFLMGYFPCCIGNDCCGNNSTTGKRDGNDRGGQPLHVQDGSLGADPNRSISVNVASVRASRREGFDSDSDDDDYYEGHERGGRKKKSVLVLDHNHNAVITDTSSLSSGSTGKRPRGKRGGGDKLQSQFSRSGSGGNSGGSALSDALSRSMGGLSAVVGVESLRQLVMVSTAGPGAAGGEEGEWLRKGDVDVEVGTGSAAHGGPAGQSRQQHGQYGNVATAVRTRNERRIRGIGHQRGASGSDSDDSVGAMGDGAPRIAPHRQKMKQQQLKANSANPSSGLGDNAGDSALSAAQNPMQLDDSRLQSGAAVDVVVKLAKLRDPADGDSIAAAGDTWNNVGSEHNSSVLSSRSSTGGNWRDVSGKSGTDGGYGDDDEGAAAGESSQYDESRSHMLDFPLQPMSELRANADKQKDQNP